jgi:capsular exopolysaccharide synthesis family protein
VFKGKTKSNLNSKRKLIAANDPKSPISEQYRTIRTNIQFSVIDTELRSVMATSSVPGEGKSTTISNLAVVFAQQGKKVLLVDADLRKPTMHYTFNLSNTIGLTSVLTKQSSLALAVREIAIENLSVLSSGPVPPNPSELLGSNAMLHFLNDAYNIYDLILFDAPPVLAVTDAQILSNICDGTIFVVHSGKTEKESIVKAKELLQSANTKILGTVLNNKEINENQYYYYGNE